MVKQHDRASHKTTKERGGADDDDENQCMDVVYDWTTHRANVSEADIGVNDVGVGVVLLDIGGVAGSRRTCAAGYSRRARRFGGRVVGVQPKHVHVVVIP